MLPRDGASKEERPDRLSDEGTVLKLEEIVAMVLEHAKDISQKYGSTTVNDVVFTIPPWWSPYEREVLYTSAKLAGLNPLAYVSENTGAAVYKAMERKAGDKDETYLYYNMGASSTKVSLVKYTQVENTVTKKMEDKVIIMGETWDKTMGGYAMDWCVAELFAKSFDAKFSTNVIENPKVMRRVLKAANKIKETLSANKETLMMVEEVFDDKDYSVKISREDFEASCKHVFDRVQTPVMELFKKTGTTGADVDHFEIIGGAVRVPVIRRLLEESVGKTTGMHLNGDDSMAMGTAFIAANYTSGVKAKKMYLEHGPNYEVNVKITDPATAGTEDEYVKETTIFNKAHQYASRKKLNLSRATDLEVRLSVPVEG